MKHGVASRFPFEPIITQDTRQNAIAKWPERLALALFTSLVASAILHHEPWGDEAQSWQLARTLPLGELFHSYIRYEVSPGLWHLLLWVLIRAGVGYAAVHWMCGAIAVAAAALLLLSSPLPRALRLTLPFTYFLIFQFAVIARSYVFVPLLLFLVALGWKKRTIWIAVLLGLLANLSLHAAALAGGLALVFLYDRLRGSEGGSRPERRRLLLFALIFATFCVAALWTAWPPHDLDLAKFRGPTRGPLVMLFYACRALFWGTCQPWQLSPLFWIAIALWLWSRRSLRFLLPVAFFAAFSGAVHVALWHMGMLTPYVVGVLWITSPGTNPTDGATNASLRRDSRRYEVLGLTAMAALICSQLAWAAFALRWDFAHEYSSDHAAADVLRPFVARGDTVAVTYIEHVEDEDFDAVGILPYFDHNIFANWAKPFWWWSDANPAEERFAALLPARPRVIVVETRPNGPDLPIRYDHPRITFLEHDGYRLTHTLCGTVPERLSLWRTSCHLIFEDAGSPQSEPTPAAAAFPPAKSTGK